MLASEIAQYLEIEGIGIFDPNGIAGDIFIDLLPPEPDECIMIRNTGGPEPEFLSGNMIYDKPGIQIITRAKNPLVAEERALTIYKKLITFHNNCLVNGGLYIVKFDGFYPGNIGQDQNGRHEYSANYIVDLRRS